MQKRLRYAMPRIPLYEQRQNAAVLEAPNDENENMPENTAAAVSNEGIMARRIGEAERKKRRAYRAPPERPLGGDIETSESDDGDESYDDDTGLLN